jgi:hypothetical protein
MPYHQAAEPAWFAAAIGRAVAPIQHDIVRLEEQIWEDMAGIREDMAGIRENIAGLDHRLEAIEAGNGHIRRLAAIVECHSFLPFIGSSLTKCRPGTVPVDPVGIRCWRLCPFSQGKILQSHQSVFFILVYAMLS